MSQKYRSKLQPISKEALKEKLRKNCRENVKNNRRNLFNNLREKANNDLIKNVIEEEWIKILNEKDFFEFSIDELNGILESVKEDLLQEEFDLLQDFENKLLEEQVRQFELDQR